MHDLLRRAPVPWGSRGSRDDCRTSSSPRRPTRALRIPAASIHGRDPCRDYEAGVGFAGTVDGSSCSSRGSHCSQPGRYQFRSPSSFIVAGRSTARTSVASIRIAAASPTPNCLKNSSERAAKIEKTATMTIAALATTPAVDLIPSAMASSMLAPRSNASRIGRRRLAGGWSTFMCVRSLWSLAHRYGFDALIVLAAVESTLAIALRHDSPQAPRTTLWFVVPATAIVIL